MIFGKQKVFEEIFKEFELVFKGGMFDEKEVEEILKILNIMLEQWMMVNFYFGDYFNVLLKVK